MAINGDGSGSTWNILLSLYEGDVHFDVYTVERYIERHTATVPVTPNAWNHIVGVFDGTTHTVRIYVNGAPAGTWTGTGSTLRNQASSEFTIGAMKYWGSWLNVFEGAIDEVVLYDDVLTAGQVQQRYLGGATSGVLGNDTDVDGDPLTAAVVAGPSHGTLSLDPAGSFIYEPDSDWNGVDSFTYDASDGSLTDPATVTITINPVNDPPTVAADDASVTVDEGSPASNSGSFADVDVSDTVTITVSVGTVTQDDLSGTWSWSYGTTDGPDDTQTVTITATDSDSAVTTTTFELVVNNDPPTVAADNATVTVDEGSPASNSGTFGDRRRRHRDHHRLGRHRHPRRPIRDMDMELRDHRRTRRHPDGDHHRHRLRQRRHHDDVRTRREQRGTDGDGRQRHGDRGRGQRGCQHRHLRRCRRRHGDHHGLGRHRHPGRPRDLDMELRYQPTDRTTPRR